MGNPRTFKKKFARPFKQWDETRLAEEKKLADAYGLKNKKEMWKTETMLRRFKAQAKKLIAARGQQAGKEKQQLLTRLASLGLISQTADLDAVLGLTIKDLLNRRLQTLVHGKNLARTVSQARQFIIHEHITVKEKKIAMPSYLVKKNEEEMIAFSQESGLSDSMHPERVQKKPEAPTDAETAEKAPAENAEPKVNAGK